MKPKKKVEEDYSFPPDFMNDLIGKYIRGLLIKIEEKPCSLNMGELIKVIELKLKCTPDSSAQKQFWEMIEGIRKEHRIAKNKPKLNEIKSPPTTKQMGAKN